MISRRYRALGLALLLCMGASAATAQDPLTLRQAVDQALGQSPQAAIAHASDQEAKSAATMAHTQLLPHLNFTEDISGGDDPVYAFGTRLRQGQFTQADFALDALNILRRSATFPPVSPVRGRHLIRSRHRGRFTAPIFCEQAHLPQPRRLTNRSSSTWSGHTSRCFSRNGRST